MGLVLRTGIKTSLTFFYNSTRLGLAVSVHYLLWLHLVPALHIHYYGFICQSRQLSMHPVSEAQLQVA